MDARQYFSIDCPNIKGIKSQIQLNQLAFSIHQRIFYVHNSRNMFLIDTLKQFPMRHFNCCGYITVFRFFSKILSEYYYFTLHKSSLK